MSAELTLNPLQALEEKKNWATALSAANLLPPAYQKQPANLLLAAEYADTLGVPRMTALTGIHVIQGKPSMSADLMMSLVRRAGHKLRVTATEKTATAVLIRADDPDFEYKVTWTMDKAKRAGLLDKKGGNWQHYPEAMLRSRAVSEVVRMGASEVLYGAIYAPEELGAQVDSEGSPIVIDAEIVEEEPAFDTQDLWKKIHHLANKLGQDDAALIKLAQFLGDSQYSSAEAVPPAICQKMVTYMEEKVQAEIEQIKKDAPNGIDDAVAAYRAENEDQNQEAGA